MRLEVKRWYRPLATYGNGYVVNDVDMIVFTFKTLELPWKDNRRSVSCIPEGVYDVVKEGPTLKRPYIYFRVPNVPGRSGILFHPGNFSSQIRGCLLPGERIKDINEDGILDIVNTTMTLKKIVDLMPDKFTLTITNGETL
jgi:hypothetical protein